MPGFVDLHLKPAALERYGLPDIPYPLPLAEVQQALSGTGELPLAVMLHGLQRRSEEGGADWKALEPAMDRLAGLLAPDDAREILSASGDDWWLEVGPVDLEATLVTVQRGDDLVAAITRREDGRLRVAVFRPLDGKSAKYLTGLGQVPHPEYGVSMRENNWEYALDASAGNGNFYADQRGEACLSCWEKGIGVSRDGTEIPAWRQQKNLVARPAARVVIELGVCYALSDVEDAAAVAETDAAVVQATPTSLP